MPTKKILLASILGGIALFIWGSLSHMVLGIVDAHIKQIPNEDAVLASMQHNIKEPGFYFFPGYEHSLDMSDEPQTTTQKWEQKVREGPNGILVYNSQGREPLEPSQLLIELLTNIVAAFLAAILLVKALGGVPSFGARVLFVTQLGLFARIVADVPYWNWYGFPLDYTISTMYDDVIGFFLVGLVLAWRLKPGVRSEQGAQA
jgi:hypothetical protein